MGEGWILIVRLNEETAPEPWMYAVAFTPYGDDGLDPRKVIGDDQLARLLRDGMGLPADRIEHTVQQARQGKTTVEHVTLPSPTETAAAGASVSNCDLATFEAAVRLLRRDGF
jgi:hypothetical protein